MVTIRIIITGFTAIFLLILGCNDTDSIVVPVIEDTSPPDIWWGAPEAGATLSDTVRLQLRYFDEEKVDSIKLVKDGAVVAIFVPPGFRGGSQGGVDFLWDTNSDSDGVHIWGKRFHLAQ